MLNFLPFFFFFCYAVTWNQFVPLWLVYKCIRMGPDQPMSKVILSPLLGWYPPGNSNWCPCIMMSLHFELWEPKWFLVLCEFWLTSLHWVFSYHQRLSFYLPICQWLSEIQGNPSANLYFSLCAASSLLLCITNSNCPGLPGF